MRRSTKSAATLLPGISRRHFMGMAAAAGLAIAGNAQAFTVAGQKLRPDLEGVWKPAFCGFCHYPCCATQVRVANDIAVEIRGDKESTDAGKVTSNNGRLCVRGVSAISNLYNPYRVKAPMKRTNPKKGLKEDPKWKEISWEEALTEVAAKFKAAYDYNPASIIYNTGFGVEESMNLFIGPLSGLGLTSLSSPGTLCPEHFNQLHLNGQMLDRLDLEYCKYVVEIGRTMGFDFVMTSAGHSAHYANTRDRVEHVVIDPRCGNSAQRGDWVPILPGTDTALGLAMLYVMLVEENKYDHWFLAVRSNAPYLIDDKVETLKGRVVHSGDYVYATVDGKKKPLVWDNRLKKAVPFDDAASNSIDFALFGSYDVDGKTYKTSLQILKDYILAGPDGTGRQAFTPEWQERYTSIPASKVREITKKLIKISGVESTNMNGKISMGQTVTINGYVFPLRPASIYMGRGMAGHMLGVSAAKALGTVNLLLGNLDVPGGIQGTGNASWYKLGPDDYGVLLARGMMQNQVQSRPFKYPPANTSMAEYYPMGHSTYPAGWKAISDPKYNGMNYKVQMLIAHGADMLGSSANTSNPKKNAPGGLTEAQKAMADIPFMVEFAYHYDLPSQFADILLPEGALLERDAIYRMFRNEKEGNKRTMGLMGTLVREPVVTPIYNTKPCGEDILFEILERAGLTPKFNDFLNKAGLLEAVSPDYARGILPQYALPTDRKLTMREIIEAKIKSDFGPNAVAEFKTHAFKPYQLPDEQAYNYWWAPESKIRLPIYYQRMVENGKNFKNQLAEAKKTVPEQDMEHVFSHYSGMPVWYDTVDTNMMPTKEYPFKLVNWKISYGPNNTGGLYANAHLNETADVFNPKVKRIIFPATKAVEYGLTEGDWVEVESEYGKITGRVHLSHMIQQQTIGIPGNWGRRTAYMAPLKDEGAYFNGLLTNDPKTLNPISVAIENSLRVKVSKIAGGK